jgi:hypothetical protein
VVKAAIITPDVRTKATWKGNNGFRCAPKTHAAGYGMLAALQRMKQKVMRSLKEADFQVPE